MAAGIRAHILGMAEQLGAQCPPLPVVLAALQEKGQGKSQKHNQVKGTVAHSADMGFASAMLYGYARYYGRLKYALGAFLQKPEKLPPVLYTLLQLAAYEVVFLDRVPDYATVHAWVNVAKSRFGSRMAGLANGVLRAVLREKEVVLLQDATLCKKAEKAPSAENLALYASLPVWLTRLWLEKYGDELAFFFCTNTLCAPCPSYRINPKGNLGTDFDTRASFSEVCKGFEEQGAERQGNILLCPAGSGVDEFALTQAEKAGWLTRQGVNSQRLAGIAAQAFASEPVWDACAGRGGKTLALLEMGVVVRLASDPHTGRLADLTANAGRLGLKPPELFAGMAEDAREMAQKMGVHHILLDAPCSGLGTLGRNPELRFRLESEKADGKRGKQKTLSEWDITSVLPTRVADAQHVQAELLAALWGVLPTGGLLLYSTCAINPAENNEQVQAFCAAQPNAVLVEEGLLYSQNLKEQGHDILYHALVRKR